MSTVDTDINTPATATGAYSSKASAAMNDTSMATKPH